MKCWRCEEPIDSVSNAGLIMGPESGPTRGEIHYICMICWASFDYWLTGRWWEDRGRA